MKTKLLSILIFSFFLSFNSYSQLPARLDSSFLSVGEYWDNYLNQYHSIISAVALPDSTLVYVAQVTAGTGSSVMIKLKHDGTIDSSFGTFGKATYTISGSTPTVKEIVLFNGKLYLSGKVNRDKFVTRMNLNGTIDNTFGVSGSRTINYGTPIVDITKSFAMDTSGNCYLGARIVNLTTSTTSLNITKINPSGNLVTTFGTTGTATFVLPTGAVSAFSDIAIDNSQRIVAAACGSNATNNVVLLVKFNQNGTLYTGFNSTGYKEWTFPSADTYQVSTNEILTDGDKIIVAGDYLRSGATKSFIMKVKSNGDFDSTFANNGLILYQNGSFDVVTNEAKFAIDGGIMIAGSAGNTTNSYISLLRILSNGAIDSAFATNGMFLNQVGTRWEGNVAHTLAIYPDDRVFLGGNSSDCDAGACYYTSSMSRVTTGEKIVVNDTTGNDTTGTASLLENNNSIKLKLYPNPLNKGQNIFFKTNTNIQHIKMISITGKEVQISFSKKSISIPSEISKGVYFVSFFTENKVVTKKIIIQ